MRRGKPAVSAQQSVVAEPAGPGTKLRKLLGCHSGFNHFHEMNHWGPDGCLEHINEIVDWMRQPCADRNPIGEDSARRLVKLAVEQAREATKKAASPPAP